MKILELVERLKDMVNEASSIPFSGKIALPKEDLEDLIAAIKEAVPKEVMSAKWIKEEKDKILKEANEEAEIIIRSAQEEEKRLLDHAKFEENSIIEKARQVADNLISENEITKLSNKEAQHILTNARNKSNEFKERAYYYTDDMLEELQEKLSKYLESVTTNRVELKKFLEKNKD